MKKVITTLMLSSALLATAQFVHADDGYRHDKGPKHSPEQRVERMADRLNLTEAQQKNILAVLQQEQETMQKMREANRAEVASYLTEEQKQQFEKAQERREQCRKGMGKDRH